MCFLRRALASADALGVAGDVADGGVHLTERQAQTTRSVQSFRAVGEFGQGPWDRPRSTAPHEMRVMSARARLQYGPVRSDAGRRGRAARGDLSGPRLD